MKPWSGIQVMTVMESDTLTTSHAALDIVPAMQSGAEIETLGEFLNSACTAMAAEISLCVLVTPQLCYKIRDCDITGSEFQGSYIPAIQLISEPAYLLVTILKSSLYIFPHQ